MNTIIDYGLGNLKSVYAAIKKLNHNAVITNDKNIILKSEKIILPGVGAFGDAMKRLKNLDLISSLNYLVLEEN